MNDDCNEQFGFFDDFDDAIKTDSDEDGGYSAYLDDLESGLTPVAADAKDAAPKAEQYLIGLAFDAHIRNMHNADFEVCENKVCQCAYALEQRRAGKGE